MLFKRKKKKRVLVLGLDGVPKHLIEKMSKDGTMPFMGELFPHGTLHQGKVCLPEVSNVNWSSFMTGANPGTHGIFGFTDLKPASYDMTFPSFPDLKVDTLWDELGAQGRRCLVLNQPGCYPARSIPGVLVSGFVAVDLKRAVSPKNHLPALEAMNYKIDVDTRDAATNPDLLFRELDECHASREAAAKHFFGLEEWDFAEIVLTGTDRLQHFHYPSCEGDGPEAERCRAFYRKCDDLCRTLVRAFYGKDDPEGLFLLSDHGFTRLEKEFLLNAWLREAGYLRFEKEPPESYGDIAPESKAFALDPGRIYIHRKGRYPKGTVEEGDVPQLVAELKTALESIEDSGQKLFQRVWTRDEIYQGPESPHGPDLLCTPRRGIDVKGGIRKLELFPATHFTGMHTWDDAFFWSAQNHGDNLYISDLRKIIAAHFNS
jgi:predicted AlkP superfamily phosphohydrolase/phosphomutase